MPVFLPLVVLLLSLARVQGLPQEYPFPNRFLKTDKSLTFCLDKQNPIWPLEEAVAKELGRLLGRPVKFYVHRENSNNQSPPIRVTRREFQVLLARYCDVYMGLLGSTTAAFDYPADEQMLATRPYYKTRYVFVSRKSGVNSLRQASKDLPIGVVGRSLPYNLILRQMGSRVTLYPVVNSEQLARKLLSGELQAGVILASALYGLERNPQSKSLSVSPLTEIANADWYVIAAVARDRVSLRGQLDQAILKLLQTGRMETLVKQAGLPLAFFTPVSPTEQRPKSEKDDDEKR